MAGPQCCENPPALSSSSGHGSILELGGLKTYVSGSSNSKHAILLISDVYGYEAPNLSARQPLQLYSCTPLTCPLLDPTVDQVPLHHSLLIHQNPEYNTTYPVHSQCSSTKWGKPWRKLADKVAAGGYYVVVPDFLYGDPYNPENKEKPIQVWIQSHGTDKGFEDAKQVIAALKEKGISPIGAAGFCWGGKVVVELAKSDSIQSAVLLHPSFVSVDDIKEVKVPIAILGAEIDQLSPPELVKQFEEILSSKPEVDRFVKIYPGVSHGWTVRYNVEDKKTVQSAEEAHQDMLDWFTKHVK
ncbi:hypothetical protein MTR67_040851 [Solanum verrucosum]|uniref:Dienelactone hydrolase domain-containing protein n=1 Tax=Solanum verrucosum TaxID=315347 RepID=A0AAF0UL31_SOLVR|nr:hypothetical protein MTR67_040851 [Solanum verrucosum]